MQAVIFDLQGVLIVDRGENIELTKTIRECKTRSHDTAWYVISNNASESSESYAKQFPFLKELFNKCYFSSDTGLAKPSPEAYTLILTENALRPEDCFYFDDSTENVRAASKLGIRSYLYESPEQVRSVLELT